MEQGVLWTETGRVSFQLLPRDSPVAGDISRGEKKNCISARKERGVRKGSGMSRPDPIREAAGGREKL